MRGKQLEIRQGARTERVIAYERGVTDGGRDPLDEIDQGELSRRQQRMPGYVQGYRRGQHLARAEKNRRRSRFWA